VTRPIKTSHQNARCSAAGCTWMARGDETESLAWEHAAQTGHAVTVTMTVQLQEPAEFITLDFTP
jgi:hypothetical protein